MDNIEKIQIYSDFILPECVIDWVKIFNKIAFFNVKKIDHPLSTSASVKMCTMTSHRLVHRNHATVYILMLLDLFHYRVAIRGNI